jgi:hypothetical protein
MTWKRRTPAANRRRRHRRERNSLSYAQWVELLGVGKRALQLQRKHEPNAALVVRIDFRGVLTE